MKKFLSLVLALVMTMSLVTVAGAADFTDDSTITYKEAVDVMTATGVVGGYADGSFNPTGKLTRGAAAKIICNVILGATGSDALSADAAPYSDVPANHTFAGYIAFCQKEGIISGYADGTFRPAADLTGYAFMKMLLGALGYDSDIEGYTGANWSISVAKRANNIGLMDGLKGDFVGTKPLTREEACLYAFNAIKAKEVNYGDKSTIKVGDIEISTNAEVREGSVFYTQYFKKLKIVAPSEDVFGRPATTWQYDGEKVGTYAKTADVSYTKEVKSEDVYADLGLSKTFDASVTEDGVDAADFKVQKNNEDAKIGANGTLTEFFLVKNNAGEVTGVVAAVINTYIAEIDDVDTNDDDERIVEIGTLSYVTEEFEEEDMVLYTIDEDAAKADRIQSMVLVEKQTGELTKKVGSSKYTIDGTVYETSATFEDKGVKVGDDVDFYVDAYGYIILVDVAESTVDVSNMALVMDAQPERSKGWASVVLSEGKDAELDTDKKYNTGLKTADWGGKTTAVDSIVSYETNDDGDYELSYVETTVKTGAVTKGNPMVAGLKTNNETLFVYIIDDAGDLSYETYTGYNAIPSATNVTATAYVDNGIAALVFVEVDNDKLSTTAADITIIAWDKDVKLTDEGTSNKYYEYNAVVDGEVTTVKVAASEVATIKAGGDFYAATGLTYNTKNIGTLKGEYTTTAGSTIKLSGDTVVIGTKSYACDEDTLVVLVDEGEIDVIDVDDIKKDDNDKKDPYKTISFQTDKNDAHVLDLVVLVVKK